MVRWMSGLVTGLQNRLQRFESASDLQCFDQRLMKISRFFCFLVDVCKPPPPSKQNAEPSAFGRSPNSISIYL